MPDLGLLPARDGRERAAAPTVALPNGFVFWPIAIGVVLVDIVTKAIAVSALAPPLIPHQVIGEIARLTLVYNPGAAFGLHVGPYSRPIFTVLTVAALAILWRLYRATEPRDRKRVVALALVSAGAIGNLLNRVQSSRGVVDFIDLGTATWRWPTFNLADIAVTTGAVLLATVLWQEDRAAARAAAAAASPQSPPGQTPPLETIRAGDSAAVAAEQRGIA